MSERFAFFRLPTKVEVGYAEKRAGERKREKEKLKMEKKEWNRDGVCGEED